MSRRKDSSGDLEGVRREIDEIDDRILDLVRQRFRAVARVKVIKGLADAADGTALRPAREAQVIRRLVAASGEEVSGAFVARLWFELMAAASRYQAPITIHLPASAARLEHQDLIRFHAGAELPIVEHKRARDAVCAAAATAADIAICPLDRGDGALGDVEDDGMTAVIGDLDRGVQVVARLPFVKGTSPVAAFAVGRAPFDPSGDDVTLLARSGGLTGDEVVVAGFEPVAAPKAYAGGGWSVVEVRGYIAADDGRLAAADMRRIGGYATAIELGDG